MTSPDLALAARAYVAARLRHEDAARTVLRRVVADFQALPAGEVQPTGSDGWVEQEIIAPDGIPLTVRCEMGDGVVRFRHKMPTAVDLERAERALQQAAEAGGNSVLLRAVVLVLEDSKEPWYAYDPGNAAEKARADARARRHAEVFQGLRVTVEIAQEAKERFLAATTEALAHINRFRATTGEPPLTLADFEAFDAYISAPKTEPFKP